MHVFTAESAHEFDRLSALLSEYEQTLRPDLRHPEFERDRTRLATLYAAPNAALVAEAAGEACGCVVLVRLDASTVVLKRLYVRNAFRRRGAARALMAASIEKARSFGYARVVLDTQREELPAAYRLYRALGFHDCDPYADVAYDSPTFMEFAL